jgi:hypothetical protein
MDFKTLFISSFLICSFLPGQLQSNQKKIGILLVNHGSRSVAWRNTLLGLEDSVKPNLSKNKNIKAIRTAFMEYTEPSIASRLKEFDADGFTDIVIVPVFLTISSHTFDDIPTIIGLKTDPQSFETLKIENIEQYSPKARIYITPNLNFSNILQINIAQRVQKLSHIAQDEGVVMIAYGDAVYENEWKTLFDSIGSYIKTNFGITKYSYGWCGHIVHYKPERTADAINSVLKDKKIALVIPVLVSFDEMFQIKIIGDGISQIVDNNSRVRYKPDSILPDNNVTKWVISTANSYVNKILTSAKN